MERRKDRPEGLNVFSRRIASGLVGIESYAPSVMGTVVACGDVQAVKLDDVVLFAPEAGQEVEYQDRQYLVLTEDELIAVLE